MITRVPVCTRTIPNNACRPTITRQPICTTIRPAPYSTLGCGGGYYHSYPRTYYASHSYSSGGSAVATLVALGLIFAVGVCVASAPRVGSGWLECTTYRECSAFGCHLVEECVPWL